MNRPWPLAAVLGFFALVQVVSLTGLLGEWLCPGEWAVRSVWWAFVPLGIIAALLGRWGGALGGIAGYVVGLPLGLAVEDGWWVTVLVFVVSAAVGTLIDRRREAA